MDEAQAILEHNGNITTVENTYLRKKVMAEAELNACRIQNGRSKKQGGRDSAAREKHC